MILTGPEIERQVSLGAIKITNYDPANVGPNSYDVRIDLSTLRYVSLREIVHGLLDPVDQSTFKLGPGLHDNDSMVLFPEHFCLAQTIEHIDAGPFVPMMEGRSSWARLGVSFHHSAGFGDIGYSGPWTMEITCRFPTIIRHGQRVAQIYFVQAHGEQRKYSGKYGAVGQMQSRMELDK